MKKKIYNFIYKLILSRQITYEIEVIAQNLNVPWAIDISNDKRIYFTERSGSIRVIENNILNPNPLIRFELPFVAQGEGGLMGIALDPNYSQNHYIYVMHSYSDNNKILNRVIRLLERNNTLSIDKILLDQIPDNQFHNGGRIKISPDRKLYITTGDAQNPSLSQDTSSLAGKILRIELNGNIPIDNLFPNSPVYSLGHRNPQGLAWSSNNVLYSSEHGQSAHDEINLIIPGGNYGWPLVQGYEDSNVITIQKPLVHSQEETWAPSGIAFANKGDWKDKLLVANLHGQQLLVMSLNDNKTEVINIESFFKNNYGRLREVIQGNDGYIYISTSNRDGRGNPNEFDDKILRLVSK
ncbi:PQQ-dependent sugar dehydrogenase [Romboutsia sp. 1001713B170207_170306_H8]|uniref:PQQ-dependent sugar dehydrogenase n=1 Tax=Romboutsia sp. 1001713B170207_170306_H8 TaxID=2787112 RepID=UPI00189BCD3C|nr:PQQ-dependent sugar dehydrogenase [Romboutsia sp. 1001713B170207_170306_H8]